jgi:hypothetical protein
MMVTILKVSVFPKYWQIIVKYLHHQKIKTKCIN